MGITPEDHTLIVHSLHNLVDASSYHVQFDETDLVNNSSYLCEGDYVGPYHFYAQESAGDARFERLIVGRTAYIKKPGSDDWHLVTHGELRPLSATDGDLRVMLPVFGALDWTEATFEFVGDEELGAVSVRHFIIELNTPVGLTPLPADKGKARRMQRINLWIEPTTERVYKLNEVQILTEPQSVHSIKFGTNRTVVFRDFDQPIELPQP